MGTGRWPSGPTNVWDPGFEPETAQVVEGYSAVSLIFYNKIYFLKYLGQQMGVSREDQL